MFGRFLLRFLVFLLLVVGAFGWFKYAQLKVAYDDSANRLKAYERIRKASEGFTAARFIRAMSATEFTFGIPVQVMRDGQTFVDYVDNMGTLATDQIYRASNPSGQLLSLDTIPSGQEIRLDMRQTGDNPPRFIVDTIYLID